MKKYFLWMMVFLVSLALAGCDFQLAPTPNKATVTVTFDLGGGGTGFAAIITAQEVTTGKTFKILYPAGSHGGVVLPTSPPVTLLVDAPGTYVFYANLNEDPDEYHYGYNGCQMGGDCTSKTLKAIDVKPGGSYTVYITERFDIVPTPGAPVNQPWVR
jgi:hypothetical protein